MPALFYFFKFITVQRTVSFVNFCHVKQHVFYVSSQASSTLYCREHTHVASQLLTRYQTASIKQESSEEKSNINPGKKISTLYIFIYIVNND